MAFQKSLDYILKDPTITLDNYMVREEPDDIFQSIENMMFAKVETIMVDIGKAPGDFLIQMSEIIFLCKEDLALSAVAKNSLQEK